VAVGVVVVLTIAGSAGAATAPRRAREISTAQDPKLGTILVASETVYTLKPSKTACSTACLKAWPPVLLPRGVKTASAGPGVDRSKLGTAAAHGARQVTYSGKRLYWYVKDTAPGQVRGNFTDKWGKWASVTIAAAASPSTEAPTTQAPATDAPATEAPATQAPENAPPATEAPATSPPQTAPPATSPPQTNPPATTSPGTGGIAF
jgi:predicted lipoprotein with Yx(FWY)xxD motif